MRRREGRPLGPLSCVSVTRCPCVHTWLSRMLKGVGFARLSESLNLVFMEPLLCFVPHAHFITYIISN